MVLPTPGSPISTGLFLVAAAGPVCAAYLVVAADDRIELALFGALRQVHRVLVERLAVLLGVGVVDGLAAADLLDGLLQRTAHDTRVGEDPSERTLVLAGGEREQLAGDVLVAAFLGQLVGDVEQAREIAGQEHLAGRPLHLGKLVERLAEPGAQQVDVGAAFWKRWRTEPPRWSSRAVSTCAGSMNWWSRPTARDWASCRAVWNLAVSLSMRMNRAPGCTALH